MAGFDSMDSFDYSKALARTLESGIPVVFYYGKTDTACDYYGGRTMADTLPWTGKDAFSKQSLQPWYIAGAEAGQIKQSGPLTFIQVESAGHMVPMDQPAASAAVIDTLISQIKSKKTRTH
jgi:carboxypeptidase C (cathepsin A)